MSVAHDMVIETLAATEIDLLVELADTRAERNAWRELALASIHKNHDLTRDLDRLGDQHHRLRDEYRALREQVMRREAA